MKHKIARRQPDLFDVDEHRGGRARLRGGAEGPRRSCGCCAPRPPCIDLIARPGIPCPGGHFFGSRRRRLARLTGDVRSLRGRACCRTYQPTTWSGSIPSRSPGAPSRHIGETDCMAGHIGFELRCAERIFISLRNRKGSEIDVRHRIVRNRRHCGFERQTRCVERMQSWFYRSPSLPPPPRGPGLRLSRGALAAWLADHLPGHHWRAMPAAGGGIVAMPAAARRAGQC
jgi:hypothetical protein